MEENQNNYVLHITKTG